MNKETRQKKLEEAREILAKTKPNGMITNHILKGINLLSVYDKGELHIAARNEQIWVCDFESTVLKMNQREIERMAILGWFESENSWSHFTN